MTNRPSVSYWLAREGDEAHYYSTFNTSSMFTYPATGTGNSFAPIQV